MKILFYSPVALATGGGCERWHCDITESLTKQFGYELDIVTGNLGRPVWSDAYLASQLSAPYTKINYPVFFGAIIPTPQTVIKLWRHFTNADVIHVIQGFIGQDILLLFLKLMTGKKIIVGHHAPIIHGNKIHNFYISHVSRYLFNFFDAHMTLNRSDKEFLENKWHVKNVFFIPSGIRINQFLSNQPKTHSTLNFLTVGSYRTYQKGIDLAIQAIEVFNQKVPKNKAVFNFVGGGLKDQKLPGNVHELGYIKYENIPDIYSNSDVYLLSSREEPFGLVLIEAWSSGIPVLATATEGPTDMVVKDQNGWLIPKINALEISKEIERIYFRWLKHPGFMTKMASYCRATGEKYSIDETARLMRKYLFV